MRQFDEDTSVATRVVFPMGPAGTGYIQSAFKPHSKLGKTGMAEDAASSAMPMWRDGLDDFAQFGDVDIVSR